MQDLTHYEKLCCEVVELRTEVERLRTAVESYKEHASDSAVLMDELRTGQDDARAAATRLKTELDNAWNRSKPMCIHPDNCGCSACCAFASLEAKTRRLQIKLTALEIVLELPEVIAALEGIVAIRALAKEQTEITPEDIEQSKFDPPGAGR